jgi:hypothetical protein
MPVKDSSSPSTPSRETEILSKISARNNLKQ